MSNRSQPKRSPPSRMSGFPALWRRLRLTAATIVAAAGLLISLMMVLVAFAPAEQPPALPRLLAILFTPTPTSTYTPTVTSTATTTPSATPTDTPTTAHTRSSPSSTPAPPTATATATLTPTPWPTPDSRDRAFYIPILMYHYISVPPEDADVYRLDLSVTPQRFREQMAWLKENGYQTITLYDLIYALNIGWPPLPEKPIILTFDDGYVDNYENAFPILREFGFVATFFILTDVTDRNETGYMTWDMLQEMHQAGMDIEVHGREHVEYINRDRDWLIFHLLGPAQTIEAKLGYQPRFIAYPSGRYDAAVIEVAREVGYWGAVTTIQGMHQTKAAPFELQRLRIRGTWDITTFAMVVSGG